MNPIPKKGSADDIGPAKVDTKERLNKLLQSKMTNPQTGNLIKVDTAMDYPTDHPAHQAALNMIRYHMKDISSRAGVPKKKYD
jgi:hypothetical protein